MTADFTSAIVSLLPRPFGRSRRQNNPALPSRPLISSQLGATRITTRYPPAVNSSIKENVTPSSPASVRQRILFGDATQQAFATCTIHQNRECYLASAAYRAKVIAPVAMGFVRQRLLSSNLVCRAPSRFSRRRRIRATRGRPVSPCDHEPGDRCHVHTVFRKT